MLFRLLRKNLTAGSVPQRDATHVSVDSERERESFAILLTDLISRVPEELRETFQDAIDAAQESPGTGSELLDVIDRMHMGLGVAIGRGQTGEDKKYQQLGHVVSWLYNALGCPADTQYAVVKRAASALKASEQKRGEA